MAIDESELALKELTKANILELRSMSKPNPLVEKSMQIMCALKGFKNLNWTTARDFLGRPSFKIELQQASIGKPGHMTTAKPEDILRAQQILVQKTNTMLTPENVQVHSQGAALILVWAANVIKAYAASKWLGIDPGEQPPLYANL